jgi:CheY-like chemotaxis protein
LAHALIVDDDHDGREPIAHVLRRAGHVVTCASDAKEALAVLTGQTPSVVILDLMMPEMDGTQLLEVIRSYLRWQSIPVIVVSGADGPLLERASSLEPVKVYRKAQYSLKDLVDTVNEVTGTA